MEVEVVKNSSVQVFFFFFFNLIGRKHIDISGILKIKKKKINKKQRLSEKKKLLD